MHASLCVDRFLSRPESGVICVADDDFVRVVGDKEEEKEEKRRRKEFVVGEKLIRIVFDHSTMLPNFLRTRKKNLFFRFSFVSLAETWPKFDSDFHSENGPWHFVGRPR